MRDTCADVHATYITGALQRRAPAPGCLGLPIVQALVLPSAHPRHPSIPLTRWRNGLPSPTPSLRTSSSPSPPLAMLQAKQPACELGMGLFVPGKHRSWPSASCVRECVAGTSVWDARRVLCAVLGPCGLLKNGQRGDTRGSGKGWGWRAAARTPSCTAAGGPHREVLGVTQEGARPLCRHLHSICPGRRVA